MWSIAAVLGAIVAARWLLGPYQLMGVAVNAPLNPEGVFGVLVTAVLVVGRPLPYGRGSVTSLHRLGAVFSAIVALVALLPALSVGFLSDDFILVHQARSFTGATLVPLFTSAGGDGFFRPLG